MTELINEIMVGAGTAYKNSGWVAALGTVLMFSIRCYQLPLIQSLVPKKMKWSNLPGWVKLMSPFFISFVGSFLVTIAAPNVSAGTALVSAFSAAVVAVTLHHGTKSASRIEGKIRRPDYRPGPIRKVAGIAVPLSPDFQAPVINAKPPRT